MPSYPRPLIVKVLDDDRVLFEVCLEFSYITESGEQYWVPVNFPTDFASVPRRNGTRKKIRNDLARVRKMLEAMRLNEGGKSEAAGTFLAIKLSKRGLSIDELIEDVNAAEQTAMEMLPGKGRRRGTTGRPAFGVFVAMLCGATTSAGGNLESTKNDAEATGSFIKAMNLLRQHLPQGMVPHGLALHKAHERTWLPVRTAILDRE